MPKKYPEFKLCATELHAASVFLSVHEVKHGIGKVHDGPRYKFEVVQCGIGTGTLLTCVTCGERTDITDYGTW